MKRMLRPIYASTCMNPRKGEYYQYLSWHISAVQKAWHTVLKPAMLKHLELDGYNINLFETVDRLVRNHDASKYNDDEFNSYCNYFYPADGFSKSEKDFNTAWLIHIHKNPHHHQHWVLIQDEGNLVPTDMPLEYICEMLCDWHSFSSKDATSTAYNWYQNNHSKMMLSKNTEKFIKRLVEYLKEPLSPEVS